MKFTKTLAAGVAAIALTAAWGGAATAQVTTSAVSGVVTDQGGAPLANTTVTITDTRTGQSRTVTTNANGQFSSRNLPVGGPYTVSVSRGGYQGERLEGISLNVGDTTDLSFDLAASESGDEIVITATRRDVIDVASGPAATFSLSEIEDLPTTNRDIKDVIRLDRVYSSTKPTMMASSVSVSPTGSTL